MGRRVAPETVREDYILDNAGAQAYRLSIVFLYPLYSICARPSVLIHFKAAFAELYRAGTLEVLITSMAPARSPPPHQLTALSLDRLDHRFM